MSSKRAKRYSAQEALNKILVETDSGSDDNSTQGYKPEHPEDIDFYQLVNSDSEDDSLIDTIEDTADPLESTANDVINSASSVTLSATEFNSSKIDFTEKVGNVSAIVCNSPDPLEITESTVNDSIVQFSDFTDESSVSMNSDIIELVTDEKLQNDVKLTLNEIVLRVSNEVDIKGNKALTRKRSTNTASWARNVRKLAHQSGKEYINSRGKYVDAKKRKVENSCDKNCKFQCSTNVPDATLEKVFLEFYKKDTNGKHDYINQTTVCVSAARRRSTVDKENRVTENNVNGSADQGTGRKKSYKYFIMDGEASYRVCKKLYLATLAISQKMVYNVHGKKESVTGGTKRDSRGKHANHNKISEEDKQGVMDHISHFPAMESHYCRAKTNKKYLEPGLNIEKMYDLYKEECEKSGRTPVKSSYYRYVFNTSFNIDFHKPKTDRCDFCEEIKIMKQEKIPISKTEKEKHEAHLLEKKKMRAEKAKDKEDCKTSNEKILLIFDLENVITLPKADVSGFFYKQKLTLYNLTGYTSDKQGYCAIWTELTSGRAGNDIASAVVKILEKVVRDYPNVAEIICWSDSCVPQNRNSYISQAILQFLSKNRQINSITMKYSITGHSCVQEVDNMHKNIEDAMQVAEFYSPLSFLRVLLKVNRSKPYCILQMDKSDFKDYMNASRLLAFNLVPYTKVYQLRFTNADLHSIEYKMFHDELEFERVNIGKRNQTRLTGKGKPVEQIQQEIKIVEARRQINDKAIAPKKVTALKSMLKHMPLIDRNWYSTVGI